MRTLAIVLLLAACAPTPEERVSEAAIVVEPAGSATTVYDAASFGTGVRLRGTSSDPEVRIAWRLAASTDVVTGEPVPASITLNEFTSSESDVNVVVSGTATATVGVAVSGHLDGLAGPEKTLWYRVRN